LSLYLRALSRAVGMDLVDAVPGPVAEPRPRSRYEDWPDGWTASTDAPGFVVIASESDVAPEGATVRGFERSAPARDVAPAEVSSPLVQRVAEAASLDLPSESPIRTPAPPDLRPAASAPRWVPSPPEPSSQPSAGLDAAEKPLRATPLLPLVAEAASVWAEPVAGPLLEPPLKPVEPDAVSATGISAVPPTRGEPLQAEARPAPLGVAEQGAVRQDQAEASVPAPVVIEIGRIEIRLDVPAQQLSGGSRPRGDDRPVLSLADYLSGQGTGARRP
jgi:hypothetical protein